MNGAGLIFFTISWASLIIVNLFCFAKVLMLQKQKPK